MVDKVMYGSSLSFLDVMCILHFQRKKKAWPIAQEKFIDLSPHY